MMQRLALGCLIAAVGFALPTNAAQSVRPGPGAATPTPAPQSLPPSAPVSLPSAVLPPAGATPAPPEATLAPALVRFTGQLLDLRNGYAYFTTGDAFKVIDNVHVTDYDTGAPTTIPPQTRYFARATLDPKTREIIELAITKHALPKDVGYAAAQSYVVVQSTSAPAPELNQGPGVTGKAVPVTFFVQVPSNTPLTDSVYIATDASGWVPNAIKLDRVDAIHYRLTRTFASGTKFAYRYTRGTWASVELGKDGLQVTRKPFFVPEADVKQVNDTVFAWSDENPTQPQVGPDSIPTPFNPNPFGSLPGVNNRTGKPQGPQPTPAPH